VSRLPDENTWIDFGHEFLETRIFAPILRLDRFFSDNPGLDEERARSYLRVRNEVRFDVEGHPAYAIGLRANLRLPGFYGLLRRMRVVVALGAQEVFDALPGEPVQESRALREGEAELRFDLFDALRAHASLGAGLLLRLPIGTFVHANLRWHLAAGELFVTDLALSGFRRSDTGFGASASVRLQRPFTQAAVLRVGSDLVLSQASEGVEWTPSVDAIFGLGPRAAASVGADAVWRSESTPHVDRYRFGVRLRRDVYRRWLFVELEPEVYWPWSPILGRHPAMAVTLRFEVQFNGNEPTPSAEDAPLRRRGEP
jgi:hypothetical protein